MLEYVTSETSFCRPIFLNFFFLPFCGTKSHILKVRVRKTPAGDDRWRWRYFFFVFSLLCLRHTRIYCNGECVKIFCTYKEKRLIFISTNVILYFLLLLFIPRISLIFSNYFSLYVYKFQQSFFFNLLFNKENNDQNV